MIDPRCEECPLNGSQKVLGEGPDKCDYVFVGMAPASEELKEGRPFVGQSGYVIRETLKKMKFPEFYVTNTLLCQIPDELSPGDERLAIECCKDRLLEEVKSREPKVVISLGNMPLRALTDKHYNVTDVEGRVIPSLVGPLVPVVHPAAFLWDILRAPDKYPDFVDSLRVGPKFVAGTYIQVSEPPECKVVDWENFPEFLRNIEKSEVTVVDLETTKKGFFPYSRDPDQIRCIAITSSSLMQDGPVSYIVPGFPSPYFEDHPNYTFDERLKEVLEKSKLIFHNSTFDLGFLWAAGYRAKVDFDTFLAHYMLDEREYTHGLKPLAKKYFGAPDWEEDLKVFLPTKKSSYDLIPDDRLYTYAASDVFYTYLLYEEFKDRARGRIFDELLMPCANMFSDIRHTGIQVDVGYLAELDDVLGEELRTEIKELQEMSGGYAINPNSTGANGDVAWLLFDMLGYPPHPKFGRSTRKAVLQTYKGDPIVDKLMACRAAGKLKSTYVSGIVGFLDFKYRIHPLTKLHGAVTGRISTEDPSVMNITGRGGIKKLYLPLNPKGLICEADAKQMELRCYAATMGDKHLGEMMITGGDPHELVRSEAEERTGREISRTKAKSGVFGRLYEQSDDSLIRAFGLGPDDGKLLLSTIDSLFPSIGEYRKTIREDIHDRGHCRSYFDRVRRFPLITRANKHELYRQGANFKIQSMASDINLFCMLHIYEQRDRFGVRPLFPVHDSIVMDIESVEVIPELRKEMEEFTSSLVDYKMTFKYDFKVGKNWGETKEIK